MNITAAAKLVGVNRSTLHTWRTTRPELYAAIEAYAEQQSRKDGEPDDKQQIIEAMSDAYLSGKDNIARCAEMGRVLNKAVDKGIL